MGVLPMYLMAVPGLRIAVFPRALVLGKRVGKKPML